MDGYAMVPLMFSNPATRVEHMGGDVYIDGVRVATMVYTSISRHEGAEHCEEVDAMASSKTDTADLTLEELFKITGHEDPFEALHSFLQRAKTPADLRTAGAAIRDLVKEHLSEEAQDQLRKRFLSLMAVASDEVKAEELDGKRTTVVKARYVDTKVGPTFRLEGTFEETAGKERKFQCWMPGSSRGPVYRFFERRAHDAYPVEVVFTLDEHPTDPDKQMWTVQALPPRADGRQGGRVPF